ncbi:hypothetical protein CANCADRAFT_63099 [Tortispora caseinolytica NRRL Y-17796]|uniref:GDP-mannose transporter n=1 Tax=Tortispora caseinolytica NRRL Y-17796 TaxID=767744 RepID=A0A1E4TIL0_9ASCO|nr:hypothetical protein CANCADRAFT_63099 [Tortispora caseinolytica NRRL Y-17796]
MVQNRTVLPVISYCASSILMTLANKYVVSGYSFNMNFLLLAVQSIVCTMTVECCKRMGVITYRDFNKDDAKKWFPISLFLVIMIYTSSKALQYLSIPVYTIFKNLTIILIAYGEQLWFSGSTVTPMIFCSFILMVLSSVVAAWADISTPVGKGTSSFVVSQGYFWMLTNCFSSAAYLLIMRKRIQLTNFKDFDTMYYNNLLTIPVLIVCSFLLEDWSAENLTMNFPPSARNTIFLSMFFTGISTVLISYCSAWCIRVTSSTTYSMVGALNKLPIALSGLIFFEAPVTFFSVSAIAIGFLAGVVYAIAKAQQKKEKEL